MVVLNLLQIAVGVKESLPKSSERLDWNRIYTCAQQQGVVGLMFKAIEKLPKNIIPEMDLLMDWLGQAEYIQQCFQQNRESAKKLLDFSWQHGVDFCVMKGLSIASLYPVPFIREFGDIDIFAFEGFEKLKTIIQKEGIKLDESPKHDEFNFENAHIELHRTFLNVSNRTGKILNAYLNKVSSPQLSNRSEDGWVIPNPDFNAVFLLRHMCVHLASEGMTLRNVLDYALLLLKEGDKIHWNEVKPLLKEASMDVALDTMVGVCEKVLDVDFSNYYINRPDWQLVDRVMDEVWNVHLHAESGFNTGRRVWKKTRRLFSRKWMYDSGLLPDRFWTEVVWGSVRDHIKQPKYW